jgi:hypothetical protein
VGVGVCMCVCGSLALHSDRDCLVYMCTYHQSAVYDACVHNEYIYTSSRLKQSE